MADDAMTARFEREVLTHLDAAYNLARWLTGENAAAEDAVQEACLRAFRFFDGQRGESPKAWFMTIVRNTCLDGLKASRSAHHEEYDDEIHGASAHDGPDVAAARDSDARSLHACIAGLPREYREVIVLRELEGLAYREIGAIVGVPLGTVMSRLARGRDLLQRRLLAQHRRLAP
ncbi:MAG TPA: sigma-70 family RNA polymerase sigma factor [Burkholderiales bacterium]|nr:sigma-70 family RNA polymerase sigma factor [Burkholderiales bacterium]